MDLVKIYDLKNDKQHLTNLQNASKDENTEVGLEITEFGLIGSSKWWSAVENGRIPSKEVVGKISKVYKTGHNDFPQFDVDSDDGITSWMQYGNWQYYKVGNGIKIVYVMQKFKKPLKAVGEYSQVVLTVEAEKVDIVKEPFNGFEKI